MRIWNLNETEEMETISQFEGPARSVASSSAGGERLVALYESPGSMSSNGTVDPSESRNLAIFNRSGGALATPERGSGYFLGTAQSPAGGRIATFDMLKEEIIVWEAVNGKVIRVFPVKRKDEEPKGRKRGGTREKTDVRCLAFRDEDELYAVTGEGLRRLRVDAGTLESIAGLAAGSSPTEATLDLLVPEDAVMALCFSTDGRQAAAGTAGKQVIVYDAETWKELVRLSGHSRGITGVAFSSDSRRLASCSGRYFRLGAADANDRPGEVIVWDTTTWKECLRLTHPEASEFAGVAFGDRDRTLFAAANPVTVSPGKLPRGEIVRWVSTAGVARIAAAAANTVRPAADSAARVSPRKSKPVGSPPATTKLSRSGETKPLEGAVFRSPGLFMGVAGVTGFTSVAVHPTGELIAAATVISRLILWDARTQEVLAEAVLPPVSWPGYAITFSPDGSHLICTIGDDVFVRSIPGLGEANFEDARLNLRPEIAATIRRIKIGGETVPIEPDVFIKGPSQFSRDGELLAALRGEIRPRSRLFRCRRSRGCFRCRLQARRSRLASPLMARSLMPLRGPRSPGERQCRPRRSSDGRFPVGNRWGLPRA